MNRFYYLLLRRSPILRLLGVIGLTVYCLLVFSCGPKKSVVIPATVIPKAKMARVITHVHLAEAEENLHSLPDSSKMKPIDFQKIFVKDTISKQQYEESFAFYLDHPELLNDVYEEVVNELSKMNTGK